MPSARKYGHYEKTARVLVKEFLMVRFPETASPREMMAEIRERRLAQISVVDALLSLAAGKEIEKVVDHQAKFIIDCRWRAIETSRAPPAGRGDA